MHVGGEDVVIDCDQCGSEMHYYGCCTDNILPCRRTPQALEAQAEYRAMVKEMKKKKSLRNMNGDTGEPLAKAWFVCPVCGSSDGSPDSESHRCPECSQMGLQAPVTETESPNDAMDADDQYDLLIEIETTVRKVSNATYEIKIRNKKFLKMILEDQRE